MLVSIEQQTEGVGKYEMEACCVRSYHVCQAIWFTDVEGLLGCTHKTTNFTDRHTIAVLIAFDWR